MDTPPPGYQPPFPVYVVEYTDDTGESSTAQAGGFTTQTEAEKLLELLTAEGRSPVRINIVPVHVSIADWRYDR